MNYSLETFNEASVGGRVGEAREGGGGGAGESSCSFSQRETSTPPHLPFTPFHIFISLIHLSILLPPSPHHVFFSFTSLFPQHSPILITDAWHSTCSVLCVAVPFFITGLNRQNPYMEQKSIWWLHCLCADVHGCFWLCLNDYFSHVPFVCFGMLGVLRGVFESS